MATCRPTQFSMDRRHRCNDYQTKRAQTFRRLHRLSQHRASPPDLYTLHRRRNRVGWQMCHRLDTRPHRIVLSQRPMSRTSVQRPMSRTSVQGPILQTSDRARGKSVHPTMVAFPPMGWHRSSRSRSHPRLANRTRCQPQRCLVALCHRRTNQVLLRRRHPPLHRRRCRPGVAIR